MEYANERLLRSSEQQPDGRCACGRASGDCARAQLRARHFIRAGRGWAAVGAALLHAAGAARSGVQCTCKTVPSQSFGSHAAVALAHATVTPPTPRRTGACGWVGRFDPCECGQDWRGRWCPAAQAHGGMCCVSPSSPPPAAMDAGSCCGLHLLLAVRTVLAAGKYVNCCWLTALLLWAARTAHPAKPWNVPQTAPAPCTARASIQGGTSGRASRAATPRRHHGTACLPRAPVKTICPQSEY